VNLKVSLNEISAYVISYPPVVYNNALFVISDPQNLHMAMGHVATLKTSRGIVK